VLWQSRLPQRNLPGADHYHYDEYNLDFDEHNLNVDDDYVPTQWQRLQHRRHSVL